MAILSGLFCIATPALRAETAQECPAYAEPQIDIQQVWDSEQVNNNHSLKDLQKMAGQPNVETAGSREVPVGLTASNLRLDSSFDVVAQSTSGEPLICAQVARFELRFGFDDTTVYLANEIPPSSCGYDQVLAHERTHIAIDRNLMAFYLPQLRGLLAGELRRIGVVRAGTVEDAEVRLRSMISGYLRDFGMIVASMREKHQQQFDNVEEYRRLSAVCNGQLAALIQGPSDSY